MKILILSDGYHACDVVFEDGTRLDGAMELFKLLSKPHQIEYQIRAIGYEECTNYEMFERLTSPYVNNMFEEDFYNVWEEASENCHWRI